MDPTNRRENQPRPKIVHTDRTFGEPANAKSPTDSDVPVVESMGPTGGSKIRSFSEKARHADEWNRTPNTTGEGAIHVKTFHTKLTDDALRYMDQSINEWLDAHPEYEVKFVHSTVGTLTSKLKEPHLICQIWV